MEILYKLTKTKLKSSVITIGSYDGIHRGHFHIIDKVNSISNQLNTSSGAIPMDRNGRIMSAIFPKSMRKTSNISYTYNCGITIPPLQSHEFIFGSE